MNYNKKYKMLRINNYTTRVIKKDQILYRVFETFIPKWSRPSRYDKLSFIGNDDYNKNKNEF